MAKRGRRQGQGEPPQSSRKKQRGTDPSNDVAVNVLRKDIGGENSPPINPVVEPIVMNVDFASMAPMETEESAEWNCQPFICSLPTSVEPEESLSDLSDLTESEEEVATERHHTRQHKKQHRKRQVQRVIRSAQRAAVQASTRLTVKSCAARHAAEANCTGVPDCDAESFAHVSTAWTAPRTKDDEAVMSEIPSHFRVIPCDPFSRKATRILDVHRRVIAVVSPGPHCPSDYSWDEVIQDCGQAVRAARGHCSFEKEDLAHRRGHFPAIAIGITRGPGSGSATTRVAKVRETQNALHVLVTDQSVRRVAGYQSSLMHCYAPKLGEYYRSTLNAVLEHNTNFRRNFRNSDFASLTVNFGPQTVCKKHRDVLNLAWGWCAVTALGNYDFRKGGHIVLWELGLVIEFPPGWTVLLPSASISHSNTPIQHGYSVTQYTGGEVFRWVKNGFQLEKDVPSSTDSEKKRRWMNGIGMFNVV
ncbi:hypothetical protein ONZ45_g18161 [Pleurotus djamor]|nr:hypothetical protein ONZ45_g18161 [Pleurotus djamor]